MLGRLPLEGLEVDHKDRIRDNNIWTNLREVTHQVNTQNSSPSKRNKSGHTGVIFAKQRNEYQAYIRVNYRAIHLGFHKDINGAIKARKEAEIKYGFGGV